MASDSKTRKDAFTVKVSIPNDLLPKVDDAAASVPCPRSHWIIDAIEARLGKGDAFVKRENYPAACTAVLKATNGKLSRLESEHVVALAISKMAQ